MVTSRVGFPTVRHGWHLRHHKQHSVSHKQNKHKQHSVKEVSWYWGSGWQRWLDWSGAFLQGLRGTEGPKTAQCSCSVHCTVCIHTYIAVHTLQSIGGDSSSYTPCPELMSHVTTRHMFALTSHASPCMHHVTCVTQMLHISRVTSSKLKSTTPRCFNLNICHMCVWISCQIQNFLFLEQDPGRIIGAVTRCKVIMSVR